MSDNKTYTAEEIVEIIRAKLEAGKNKFLFDGITISDALGYGYSINNVKDSDTLIKVCPITTCYCKVWKTNLKIGFGRDYEEWANEHGLGEPNCSGIPTLFNKEVFFEHILTAS